MIFTSYRRTDSAAFAGRIADFFAYRYPDIPVFLDIGSIKPGDDFAKTIADTLHASSVVLAIIGETWLDCTDESGHRRLEQKDDFVRRELAMALHMGSRVIPVLLDNARMPPADKLPEDLKPLASRNAQFVRGVAFQRDVESLGQFVRTLIVASPSMPAAITSASSADLAVHSELKEAFIQLRDLKEDGFLICENGAGQFVQFATDDAGVCLDLPSHTLTPKQIIAAQALLSESYQPKVQEFGDSKNFSYQVTMPLEPAFLSYYTQTLFARVYGAVPTEPFKITVEAFG